MHYLPNSFLRFTIDLILNTKSWKLNIFDTSTCKRRKWLNYLLVCASKVSHCSYLIFSSPITIDFPVKGGQQQYLPFHTCQTCHGAFWQQWLAADTRVRFGPEFNPGISLEGEWKAFLTSFKEKRNLERKQKL
jgi:hypothetical protein